MGPRVGLDECGKSRPTGIRSTDCPAHSESLTRLNHLGPQHMWLDYINFCLRRVEVASKFFERVAKVRFSERVLRLQSDSNLCAVRVATPSVYIFVLSCLKT